MCYTIGIVFLSLQYFYFFLIRYIGLTSLIPFISLYLIFLMSTYFLVFFIIDPALNIFLSELECLFLSFTFCPFFLLTLSSSHSLYQSNTFLLSTKNSLCLPVNHLGIINALFPSTDSWFKI